MRILFYAIESMPGIVGSPAERSCLDSVERLLNAHLKSLCRTIALPSVPHVGIGKLALDARMNDDFSHRDRPVGAPAQPSLPRLHTWPCRHRFPLSDARSRPFEDL